MIMRATVGQDFLIALAQIIMALSMIPALIRGSKFHFGSSVGTTIGLCLMSIAFIWMELWMSFFFTVTMAFCWFMITIHSTGE